QHDLDRDADPYRELTRLDAAVVAEHQRDEADDQGDVPHPENQVTPSRLVHGHTAQPGYDEIGQSDYRGGETAEYNAHHVHRTQPTPRKPGDVTQKIIVVELDRHDGAD